MSFGTVPLTNNIAWLSLCMLAASWGQMMPPQWRFAWSMFGVFGLAAALGLQTVAVARSVCVKARQRREVQRRTRARVKQFENHLQSRETVRAATRRILEDTALHTGGRIDTDSQHAKERSEPRTNCRIPIELFSVGEESGDVVPLDVTAYLRDISLSGIGLLHDRPLHTHRVLLRVQLSEGGSVALLAALVWHQPAEKDGWYASGGKVVKAVEIEDGDFQPLWETNSPVFAATPHEDRAVSDGHI